MIIFISLAGHLAISYWHSLLIWQFFPQRKQNYFVQVFWYLMILSMLLHFIYALGYISIIFKHPELIKYSKIMSYIVLAFYPAFLTTLFLGELTKLKKQSTALTKVFSFISKDPKLLFRVSIGISLITLIEPLYTEITVGYTTYIFGNVSALVYSAVFFLLWITMILLGFRPATDKLILRQKPFALVIAIFLLLTILSILNNFGNAWSIIPIFSTGSLSLVFCWYRFRTLFMDSIFNQFIRILMIIVIVIGLTKLMIWMNAESYNISLQMLFLLCFVLSVSLLFSWVYNKLTLLWHPPRESLALVHSQFPQLLSQCSDTNSSIAETEKYLSELFSTKVAINRPLENTIHTLLLEGEPELHIHLNYMKQWMPWFSEALHWVQTAGIYLQSHLKLLQALEVEHQQQIKTKELVSLAAKAELNAMRSQIRPHFLFNILNSIHSFIRTEPKQAEHTIEILSDIMRSTLSMSEKDQVPLNQELSIVKKYLSIEKVRYGDQFDYQIEINPECLSLLIPPFSVQPLVENVIKHAVDAQFEPVSLSVSVSLNGNQLLIQVFDDGPGISQQSSSKGLGIALKNIKDRLQILYGKKSELKLENRPDKGTAASILIPINNDEFL